MSQFLPFALPDIGDEEISEVLDSLRSGWLTTGPKTAKFERDFAEFLGDDIDAVAVNSATSGLHLALEAIGISKGDEVITSPYTFTSTAEVVRYVGADVVFVDINPDTLNIDTTQIEAAITPKTKAIIPVHVGGLACDMDEILGIAKQYSLKVVEDAAHALPTTYNENLIGSIKSDASVFSFYVTKTLSVGEGGMLVTRNSEIANRCRIMRLHGIDRDVFDRYTTVKPSWFYKVVAPGFKYNMTDISASLGIHQLKKAWRFQKRRLEIASYYNKSFKNLPLTLPPKPANNDIHAWHLYIIRLRDEVDISRNHFIERMTQKDIGCSVHFIPLHLQPYWRDRYKLHSHDFPNAVKAYERAVSLPLYTKMSLKEQERVVNTVHEILE